VRDCEAYNRAAHAMKDVALAIREVLETADPTAKIMIARRVARAWRQGHLTHAFCVEMPMRPARPAVPLLLAPNKMPKRKSGALAGRIALLHALAHIEFVAIDLAFDMAGRFGEGQPRAFVDDWIGVGADEALHFALLNRRLRDLGSHYGAHPAHDGLWEAAESTKAEVLARLAIVPMVLEARGLDVSPATIAKLERGGDLRSAAILNRIYHDEIRHVGIGTKWFNACAESMGYVPEAIWKSLVQKHFRGDLKPPFNDSARESAGLTRDYYAGLVLVT
jgi:uncharacterized ferritin-like protein (DUF455 family)